MSGEPGAAGGAGLPGLPGPPGTSAAAGPAPPADEGAPPLVLTAWFDEALQERLDALRRQHFPAARNVVPAHLTLFHRLPAAHREAVGARVGERAAQTTEFAVTLPAVRSLGRGVALDVAAPELVRIRAELQREWFPWLGPQDRAPGFRPHVTVQNKVDPVAARVLYEALRADWAPLAGRARGLRLWWYQGGPWRLERTCPFAPPAAG